MPCSNDLDIPWFAAPVYTEEEVEMYHIGGGESKGAGEVARPRLPGDPRQWSRAEVCQWVEWMCAVHRLPSPDIDRSVQIRVRAIELLYMEAQLSETTIHRQH